jgi:AraC-like DNA-binding protein
MLYRFPAKPVDQKDPTYLTGNNEAYAKLKIEAKAGQRTVLITELTMIFVIKGIKLLHFANETIQVTPDKVFLLKKGIYVMGENIEEGLPFEALMLFLPQQLIDSFLMSIRRFRDKTEIKKDCLIIPASYHLQDLKTQLRQYFRHNVFDYANLMPLKQQEAVVLLQATAERDAVISFLQSAICDDLEKLNAVVCNYLFQPITIAEMANLSNRSLSTFKRDFQKRYQASPRSWINKKRLEHAKLLIENTDKTITEVSTACGFDNSSYFIRLYRTAYHHTPGSARAKIANY